MARQLLTLPGTLTHHPETAEFFIQVGSAAAPKPVASEGCAYLPSRNIRRLQRRFGARDFGSETDVPGRPRGGAVQVGGVPYRKTPP
jgi:hypothetical protein